MSRQKTAIVIGAGPAGLIALKELLEAGVDARCLEAARELGGVYAASRVYEGAVLTTSSNMVSFGALPAPHPEAPTMWTAPEYVSYLRDFVAAFSLHDRIELSTRVLDVHATDDGGGVTVAASNGATHRVDHVVVCTGLNTHAPPPAELLPCLARYTGTVVHSSQLRGASELAGKRVCVVGGGESGSDICLMAARVGAACTLSMRSGPGFVIPRYAFGLPSDVDTCRAHHALPRWLLRSRWWRAVKLWLEARCLGARDDARVLDAASRLNAARGRGPFERFGTKCTSLVEAALYHGMRHAPAVAGCDGERVSFVDGSSAQFDIIVVCTGYRTVFPFLERHHAAEAAALRDVRRALFKRMLAPSLGARVLFCGLARPGLGAIPPVAELQARYIAALCAGRLPLPSADAMARAIAADAARDEATYPDDAARVRALTDYAPMMDALGGLLGARPRVARLLLGGHWRCAWRVLFSSLSGAQFRLHGPGANWAAASRAIASYPTLPLPIVLWELLSLCACRLLAALGLRSFELLMS